MALKKIGRVAEPAPDSGDFTTTETSTRNGFRTKRKLTLDIISVSKLAEAGEFIVRCDSELTVNALPSQFSTDGKAEAWTVDVTKHPTGEQFMLACNAVVASALRRAGTPLAGRHFAIEVGPKRPGKRYRDTRVEELEEEE
jgi:hypothetical protein